MANNRSEINRAPWKVEWDADGDFVIFDADSRIVAITDGDSERDEANAALIEAAPQLLAACKLALVAFERNDAIDWNILDQAIDKTEKKFR